MGKSILSLLRNVLQADELDQDLVRWVLGMFFETSTADLGILGESEGIHMLHIHGHAEQALAKERLSGWESSHRSDIRQPKEGSSAFQRACVRLGHIFREGLERTLVTFGGCDVFAVEPKVDEQSRCKLHEHCQSSGQMNMIVVPAGLWLAGGRIESLQG